MIRALASLVVLVGCSDGTYDVRVRFDPESLATDAVVVELAVVERCADQDDRGGTPVGPVLRSVVVRRGETPVPLGGLAPGSYGLYGRARSLDCVVVAAGCADVTVEGGGSGTLEVTLTGVDGGGCPPAARCATGQCIGPDAGRDGGIDGGVDAGFDAGPDVPCTDGEACTRAGASGMCYGESCCTGCWTGTECVAGTSAEACGTAGGACATCGCPTNGCATGECVVPVPVAQIDAGHSATCAVARDGTLYCWGHNSFGQLGLGDAGDGTERDRPARVGTLSDWMTVMLGDDTTCGWQSDRTAWCWGDNTDGQHGLGDRVTRAVPQGLLSVAWMSYAYGLNDHACGLKDDATLWCWGENQFGQLGLGDMDARVSPTQIGTATWSAITPGGDHTCGIQTDGSLWCWGLNDDGELGVGDVTARPVPTRVGTATWDRLWAGQHMHCGRQTGGNTYCWGAGQNGQLGIGAQEDRSSPVLLDPPTGWEVLAGAEIHNCGLRGDGTLWCWGQNAYGQLGRDTAGAYVITPEQVGTRTDWVDVGLGQYHTCALRADGTVWCTGRNQYGQLGVGDRVDRSELTPVCF